jgi:sigma-B regulation protein RsbU (phosphoserine phosphatase)
MSAGPTISVDETYLKGIEKKVEDLGMIMEVSVIISSTLDFNELITVVMEKAKKVMDAEACSILFYNKDTHKLEFEVALCKEESASEILKKTVTLDIGQGIAGWVAENLQPLVITDVKGDKRFYQAADKQTGFTTKSIIAVPLVGRSGLIGVAEIINPKNKDFFSEYDSGIFQTLCRGVAIAIENARFHRESIEREKLRQELEIASTIQQSFLPESPTLQKNNITVSAINISAKHVGGDIYDFIEPSEGRMGVFIGDVSGKGISAALYMAKIISDLRYTSLGIDSPDVVMKRLNSHLSNAPRGMFLTATYIIADTVKGSLSISVAGHPPFFLIRKGEVRVMDLPSGPPLGIMPVEYPVTMLELDKGDRILLLTDGAFDAKNKDGERIGFDGIAGFVKSHSDMESLIHAVVDYVDDFSKGMESADDLTLVELRFDGPA